jgi:hypothetical protein
MNESMAQCLDRGRDFVFGVLLEPWIDDHGIGPHFLPHVAGQCYRNPQPLGSPLYQRFTEFYGPLMDITTGTPNQGYGDDSSQLSAPGYFGQGSLYSELSVSSEYDIARNCTRGFFFKDAWFPGTCEADIICDSTKTAQALICPEGYICSEGTTDATALSIPCAPGYVCDFGTTPDVALEAPQGQYKKMCPRAYFCPGAIGEGLSTRHPCPKNYFCPSGTVNPYLGLMANDATRRGIAIEDANPFTNVDFVAYVNEGDVREFSRHDWRCLNGINDELAQTFTFDENTRGHVRNTAIQNQRLCGRDSKWRLVHDAIERRECNCVRQVELTLDVFAFWSCTTRIESNGTIESQPCFVEDLTLRVATRVVDTTESRPRLAFPHTSTKTYDTFDTLMHDVVSAYASAIESAAETQIHDDLYDMYHAVQHVEHLKASTLEYVNFVPGTAAGEILRLDMCECQRLLKCPNGTVAPINAESIFDCVKAGDVILQRLDLIPPGHPRQVNGRRHAYQYRYR